MLYKTIQLPLVKAAGQSTAPEGTIVGYASVFGLRDLQGDIVQRGAFAKSLAGWRAVRQAPALLWQHAPTATVGIWETLHEDTVGLYVRGTLNLSHAAGRKAWAAISQGRVSGLSIGYLVTRSHTDAARKARVLTEIRLEEISLVAVPANPAAKVTSIKQHKDMTWIS